MRPLVSVIIPVYQDWNRLSLCLEALAAQTLPAARFEILVVDNEAQSSRSGIGLPPNARLLHEPRPGSYCARNTALNTAEGDVVAFTDSDCIPSPEWLESGLRLLEKAPHSRVTGPISVFREAGGGRLAYLYDFHTAFKQKQIAARGRCATANMLVRREIFDAVGPFDERLLSGGDADWGDRAHRAGVPIIYDESVLVRHPARRSVGEIIKKRRRMAGAAAQRMGYSTYRYFLLRLLPPFRNFQEFVLHTRRGKIGVLDKAALFFVHWAIMAADGMEFLSVRKGWKAPNRS